MAPFPSDTQQDAAAPEDSAESPKSKYPHGLTGKNYVVVILGMIFLVGWVGVRLVAPAVRAWNGQTEVQRAPTKEELRAMPTRDNMSPGTMEALLRAGNAEGVKNDSEVQKRMADIERIKRKRAEEAKKRKAD